MIQHNKILEDLLNISANVFPEEYNIINEKTRILYNELCKQDEGKPKKITMHSIKKIYPCIAFYKTIINCTGQQQKAYSIIDEYFKTQCNISAKKIQKICKMPLIYKLIPKIMASVIHRTCGEKSGFKLIEHKVNKDMCHIDIIKCPYHLICSLCGCTELTVLFCNSDDIAYGNMHKRLSWERKRTLGRGDNYCDFILRIKK